MQLVDNQYQQKSEVLYAFSFNKYYAYRLIVEPSNLEFLATVNTEFDDQNGRPLEIEDKISLALLIDK